MRRAIVTRAALLRALAALVRVDQTPRIAAIAPTSLPATACDSATRAAAQPATRRLRRRRPVAEGPGRVQQVRVLRAGPAVVELRLARELLHDATKPAP